MYKINIQKQIETYAANNYYLPRGIKPILQLDIRSKILIIGAAPGLQAHKTGVPWNDKSGERLRNWLNVSENEFYNKNNFALISMNFWFPGYNKNGADKAPSLKDAELWHRPLLQLLPNIKLTLLVGACAQRYYLKDKIKSTMTRTVKAWQEYLPSVVVLPHPSWHNNAWLTHNSWFEKKLLPDLRRRIKKYV